MSRPRVVVVVVVDVVVVEWWCKALLEFITMYGMNSV